MSASTQQTKRNSVSRTPSSSPLVSSCEIKFRHGLSTYRWWPQTVLITQRRRLGKLTVWWSDFGRTPCFDPSPPFCFGHRSPPPLSLSSLLNPFSCLSSRHSFFIGFRIDRYPSCAVSLEITCPIAGLAFIILQSSAFILTRRYSDLLGGSAGWRCGHSH